MSDPDMTLLELIFLAFALVMLVGYVWFQAKSVRVWRGAFLGLALAPIVVWAIWLIKLLRDTSVDPTSHAMFPFEIAFIATSSLAFLIVVAGIRRIMKIMPPK
jgi:uncharacterized Tic20 family protein